MSEKEKSNAQYRLAGKVLEANNKVRALLQRLSYLDGDQTIEYYEHGEPRDLSRDLNVAVKNAEFLQRWYELSIDPRYAPAIVD
jgi:hypothetical protein